MVPGGDGAPRGGTVREQFRPEHAHQLTNEVATESPQVSNVTPVTAETPATPYDSPSSREMEVRSGATWTGTSDSEDARFQRRASMEFQPRPPPLPAPPPAGPPPARRQKRTAVQLAAEKCQELVVAKDVLGNAALQVAAEGFQFILKSEACKPGCRNRGECLHTVGGFNAVVAYRRHMWACEKVRTRRIGVQTHDGQRMDYTSMITPRGANKARQDRIRAELQAGARVKFIYLDKEKTRSEWTYDLCMVTTHQRRVPVCFDFWLASCGLTKQDRMFRRARTEIVESTLLEMAGGADDGNEHDETPTNDPMIQYGQRTEAAAHWLAQLTAAYGEALPHIFEFRLPFADWTACHKRCYEEFDVSSGGNAKDMICGLSHFRNRVVKHPVVLNAVAQKAGFESHEAMVENARITRTATWKAVPHDPRKKGMFSNCSTCGRIAQAKQKAFVTKNAADFKTIQQHSDLHYETFMARRALHNANMALAQAYPDEVLAICMDAIDRKKLDQPYLARAVRRNKQFKDRQRFRSHCIGGIAHGHKEERFLFCHDDLIGNGGDVTGAGMNATLTVLMLMLQKIEKLPSSPHRRELRLQFDNCGDNKNYMVFVFCALLVHSGMFTAVHVDMLIVGHTHVLIDQWFSTVSSALQTTDEDISTLPKMQKYLGERFKCPVIELDALWDFKTFFARQAAKMSGHSFPYSFRFERDAHQAVKTTYQTSEDCTGRWYDMEPLESVPEVFSWEIPFMKLRRYSDLAEYHESGNDEVDAILKLVNELDANTVSLPNGDSARSLPEDSVTWWREHIATLKDEAWVTTRETEPRGFPKEVSLKRFAVTAPPGVVAATHESGTALGLFRPERMAIVQSQGIRGSEVSELAGDDQTAYSLQLFAEKCKAGTVGQDDLPKKGDLVVWAWREDEVDLHDEDLHEEVSEHPICFAMGRLTADAYLQTASRTNKGKGDDWRVDVQSFMPTVVQRANWTQPATFSRSKFAPELEPVDVSEDIAASTFANRAAHNKSAREAYQANSGPLQLEDQELPGAGASSSQNTNRRQALAAGPEPQRRPAKKRKKQHAARRAQRTATFGADLLILFPQVTRPDKWAYTRSGTIAQAGGSGLKHKVAFACAHYACREHPERCPTQTCGPALGRVRTFLNH